MQIKLIFTTTVLHLASFSKWEFLKLGNGLYSLFLGGGRGGKRNPMAYPLIVTEISLVVHVCSFELCICFSVSYDVESGVFESFIVGNISLNEGLILETQGNIMFEDWEGYSSLVYTWVEQQIQALSNKYFLVPTVRSLLITITLMRDSQMKAYKKTSLKLPMYLRMVHFVC